MVCLIMTSYHVMDLLSHAQVEQVYVDCIPFHGGMTDIIVKVLDSVPCSTVKSLVLSGNGVDDWIQLLACVVLPHRPHLWIQGVGAMPQ